MTFAVSWPTWLCLLSAALSLYVLSRVWEHRDRPGGRLFCVTIGAMTLWATTYGVALTVFDPALRRLFEVPLWIAVNATGLSFVAFALAYTGRSHLLRSPAMGVVAGALAVSVLALVAPIEAVQANYAIDTAFGAATVTYDHGLWLYATAGLNYLLLTVAILLLVDTVASYGADYRRQAVAIALSPLPVAVVSVLWLLQVGPVWQLNLTAMAFPLHLALDMYALFQGNMFVLTPGVRRAGERAAVDDLGTAVALVDDDDRVVTLNDEAERLLGVDTDAALARPLAAFVDADLDDDPVRIRTDGVDRRFAVATSPFTGPGGEVVGSTVVLQDVTREHRREQRLTVLNRVLRHNLRNDLTVVRGHAEIVADALDDPTTATHVETILDEIDGLVALGEKARTFEALAGDVAAQPLSPATVAADVADDLRGDHPEATIEVAVPADLVVEADADLLRLALRELVENAVEHGSTSPDSQARRDAVEHGSTSPRSQAPGDAVVHGGAAPTVTVGVADSPDDRSVVLTVGDDGPGIPDHEVAPLGADAESDLEHASGIGLWLVQWSVAALGGDLAFAVDDGTTVRVRLPRGVDEEVASDAVSETETDAEPDSDGETAPGPPAEPDVGETQGREERPREDPVDAGDG
jgi:signal transduction histidine kinase